MTPTIDQLSPFLSPITANNRSILSTFRRSDKSNILSDDDRINMMPKADKDGADIIVIHPGSRNFHIGFASDAIPKIFSTTTAVRLNKAHAQVSNATFSSPKLDFPFINDCDSKEIDIFVDDMEESKEIISSYLPKKLLPNSKQQMYNFNRNVQPSVIAGHNDAFGLEWTIVSEYDSRIVGIEALRIPLEAGYRVHFPIHQRHLNFANYETEESLLSDLHALLQYGCEKELNVNISELSQYAIAIVLPDTYSRLELKSWLHVAFDLGFKSIHIVHESMAATFGAGIGSACVVDIGAQQTTVAVVEDGFLHMQSRRSLDYGSDHLIPFFFSFLKYYDFPYGSLSLSNPCDVDLLVELKERCCSLVDSDFSIKVIDFYNRQPGQPTASYQFKSYEERYLVPQALFMPQWLCFKPTAPNWYSYLKKEDAEEVIFERTKPWQSKKNTTEASEAVEAIAAVEDDSMMLLDVDDLSSVHLPSEPPDASVVESLTCFCAWVSCKDKKTEFEARPFIEHIFQKHLSDDFICCWPLCDVSLQVRSAMEAHLMLHFVESSGAAQASKKSFVEEAPNGTNSSYERNSVDEAIISSILSIESDPDRLRRWFGSILLVGGGHLLSGFKEMLSQKIREKASIHIRPEDRIGAIFNTRDVDPLFMTWKGACIASRLESFREFWICRKEWYTIGVNSFLDKYPFINL